MCPDFKTVDISGFLEWLTKNSDVNNVQFVNGWH